MPDLTISIFWRNGVTQKRLPDISNKLKWIFAWGLPTKEVVALEKGPSTSVSPCLEIKEGRDP